MNYYFYIRFKVFVFSVVLYRAIPFLPTPLLPSCLDLGMLVHEPKVYDQKTARRSR